MDELDKFTEKLKEGDLFFHQELKQKMIKFREDQKLKLQKEIEEKCSNGLYLTDDICEIPEVLKEYFSPEELFEIFQLNKIDEGEND